MDRAPDSRGHDVTDTEAVAGVRPLLQSDSPRVAEAIHRFATRIRRTGEKVPSLRRAGLWVYGEVTRWFPGGDEVERFGDLGFGVYRGAQPSRKAFLRLKEQGVQTVINLRLESDHEREIVAELDMRYVYLPLPPLAAPSHDETATFLLNVTDPAHGPVFFHCYHGVDRTGTMAACLRIARDGWSVDDAIAEMRAFGLNEHGQRVKRDYVPDFCEWWMALPHSEQCRLLNRPQLSAVPVDSPTVWQRLVAWFWHRVRRVDPGRAQEPQG